MKLRPYQEEAVNAVRGEWAAGNKATLLVLATGTGKTVIFSEIARRTAENGNGVLVLAHRGELIDQAASKLQSMCGAPVAIEKAQRHYDDEGDGHALCVGSVQTLQGARLDAFPLESFKLLVVDEAHHAVAESYRRIIERHMDAGGYLLGVTATADRADRRGLSEVFDSIAYEYPLARAVADGYLVPITAKCIPLRIDLSDVKVSHGDFQAGDLGSALDPYLPEIAREMAVECAGKKTVCFLPLVATAESMAEELNRAGLRAVSASGYDSAEERARKKDMFERGDYDVLCNSMLYTEGWDCPAVDCVVVLRPTKSRSLYCLDEQTEVLTRDGWKKDVEIGENIAAFDMNTSEIKFTPCLAKVRRKLKDDEYFCSICGPQSDIRVTNKHRMVYDNKRAKGWKIKNAEDLAKLKDGARIPVSGYAEFSGVNLTDDELRFIGWFLSDGTLDKANNAIYITQSEEQPWESDIDACLKGCGFKYSKATRKRTNAFDSDRDCIVWSISKGKPRGKDKHLRGWGDLEPYIGKEIPDTLSMMTEHQFDVMLHAIHLGDGAKQANQTWTRHSYHISTGNLAYAGRLQIMALQRGWKANLSTWTNNNGNPIYCLHMKKKGWQAIGSQYDSRPQWVSEPHSDEMCWCVENELGTLVTRRNGKVAIVGNCQMVGRGTRLAPGKERLLLLDFLWMTERHDLARPASLLGKEPKVAEKMTEIMADDPDVEWGLEALAETAEKDVRAEREAALARELAAQRKKKKKLVDPLQFAASIQELELEDYVPTKLWECGAVTDKQREIIERFGVDSSGIENAGQASAFIDALTRRIESGLATPKQIRCLERNGFQHVGTWSFEAAHSMIGRLAACGWQAWKLKRAGIDPETYDPREVA